MSVQFVLECNDFINLDFFAFSELLSNDCLQHMSRPKRLGIEILFLVSKNIPQLFWQPFELLVLWNSKMNRFNIKDLEVFNPQFGLKQVIFQRQGICYTRWFHLKRFSWHLDRAISSNRSTLKRWNHRWFLWYRVLSCSSPKFRARSVKMLIVRSNYCIKKEWKS